MQNDLIQIGSRSRPLHTQEEKERLKETTKQEILDLKTDAAKSLIEIGRLLVGMKEVLAHGEFLRWVKDSFAWTPRTAQNYMRTFEFFADKHETVSHLPDATVHQLARSDRKVRDDILREMQLTADVVGPMPEQRVKQLLKEAAAKTVKHPATPVNGVEKPLLHDAEPSTQSSVVTLGTSAVPETLDKLSNELMSCCFDRVPFLLMAWKDCETPLMKELRENLEARAALAVGAKDKAVP